MIREISDASLASKNEETPSPPSNSKETPSPSNNEESSPPSNNEETPSPSNNETPSPPSNNEESSPPSKNKEEPSPPSKNKEEPSPPSKNNEEVPSPPSKNNETPSPPSNNEETPSLPSNNEETPSENGGHNDKTASSGSTTPRSLPEKRNNPAPKEDGTSLLSHWIELLLVLVFAILCGILFMYPKKEPSGELTLQVLSECSGMHITNETTELVIPENRCNMRGKWHLDLSSMKRLKRVIIGNSCFENVDVVRLVGLRQLEQVEIGMNCFSKKSTPYMNPDRHFYLKDCPMMQELRIGSGSFVDYSVCEIESVPSLGVIEMGSAYSGGNNFFFASLELRSTTFAHY